MTYVKIRPRPYGEGDSDGDRIFYKRIKHDGHNAPMQQCRALMPDEQTSQPENCAKRSLDPTKRTTKRPKVKIPKGRLDSLKGRLDSTRLKEQTLASLGVLWEYVDDGSITVDDLHEAETDIAVLIEKFRHGPNRYISEHSLL